MRALWYLLVVVLGAISLISAICAINLLLGGLTAYGAGQLIGAFLLAARLSQRHVPRSFALFAATKDDGLASSHEFLLPVLF